MEREKLYKVEVLHYINPHLIWVLSEKEGKAGQDIFLYEQIGIYGIIPLDVKLDYEGKVKKKRSDKWLPAVTIAMEKILLEASEVWFSVIYLDQRSSIFDDNLHKYGDLIVKMKNGKSISILEELKNMDFVEEDTEYFDQNLRTNLSYVATVGVMNAIKKSINCYNHSQYLEKQLNKQTSTFQKMVELEKNLVIHNHETQFIIEKHLNNLNFCCKDLDEVRIGRACSVNKSGFNKPLYQKLLLNKSKNSSLIDNQPVAIKKEGEWDDKATDGDSIHAYNGTKDHDNKHNNDRNVNLEVPTKILFNKKAKENRKMIAMGPPGLNPFMFLRREVIVEKATVKPDKEVETNVVQDTEVEDDIFDKIDSEINIKIDNLDKLKFENKLDYSVPKLDKLNNCRQDFNSKTSDVGSTPSSLSDDKPPLNSLKYSNMKTAASHKITFLHELISKRDSSTSDSKSSSRKGP